MRVTLLAGGTGGARLADGFQRALPAGDLAVVVNVGDDTELFGLHVSPDVDSVLYTLAGMLNPETGWGVAGDTWTALGLLGRYGEPAWFRIGDADLATHVRRSHLLAEGATLTDATLAMAEALGIPSRVLPASDGRLRTMVGTDAGELDFQDYFVGRRQEPEVRSVRLDGVETARPTEAVLVAIDEADLLVIAPSNPLVSIGPILALPGIREAFAAAGDRDVPRMAVSPIIAGRALKGPADRMLASLGHEPSATGVARLYAGLIDTFVLDEADVDLAPAVAALGMGPLTLPTIMGSAEGRQALAQAILASAGAGR